MAFPLTDEQKAVVDNTGGELLVSAAAGSGKTRVLVERLLDRVCREGVDIDRFLVITYTRAAAAELKSRVAEELSLRLRASPGDPWLRRQTTLVYQAPISTIHSFCSDLLREFGHRIDLSPDCRLMDEGESGLLRLRVLEDLVEKAYETIEQSPNFAALVDTLSAGRDDRLLFQITSALHLKLQAHPDPLAWLEAQRKNYDLSHISKPEDTLWGKALLDDAAETCEFWADRLEKLVPLCAAHPGLEANYLPSVQDGVQLFSRLAQAARTGWNETVSACRVSFLPAGRKKMDQTLPEVGIVKAVRQAAREALEELQSLFCQGGQDVLADLSFVRPAVEGLFDLTASFHHRLAKEKEKRRLLDFSDLEHLAVRLLEHQEIAETLSRRYAEVMVDEYQDSNQVQNVIFHAVSDGGRILFQVGDVKQSIYRFRLADPTLFLKKYETFPREGAKGQPRLALLTKNFRSRPQVLGAVNDLFRSILSPHVGELSYTPDQALSPGGSFPMGDDPCWNTGLDVIFSPAEEETVHKDLLEARWVARRIRTMLDGGMRVTQGDGLRPMRPGDVAVILRSPNSVTHHYARAFREEGLLWQTEGNGDLLASLEVQVALSLLQVVDNPRQDVPLIAALRSPVWRMTADRLAHLRSQCKTGDFYDALQAGAARGETDCISFLHELDALRLESRDLPAHAFLWLLYERTDLPGIFAAMDGGEERRNNLLLLYEYARTFEGAGHKGLYRFLTYLRRLAENGQSLSAAPPQQGGMGVTLLSIHRSKGLEFPVVIVAGLTRRFNRTDLHAPLLFHAQLGVGPRRLNKERGLEYSTIARTAIARKLDLEMLAEEMRLLYVAMTRAKDKLILTCSLPGGERALAALALWAEHPVPPQRLERCQSMGQWVLLSALSRPEAQALRQLAGAWSPVRTDTESQWDIRVVVPDGEGHFTQRDAEASPSPLPQGLAERLAWVYSHGQAVDLPSKLTATQLKGRDMDKEAAEQTLLPAPTPSFPRPRFLREEQGLTPTERGTALHQAMQFFDFSRGETAEAVEEELDRLVREEFLTPAQREVVSGDAILTFFRSELGREILSAPRLEREFKFSLLCPASAYFPDAEPEEEILFQGVIDCWFESQDGQITVVDLKTDRRPDPQRYVPQVTSYAHALERITGKPVTRKLLYFFSDGSLHSL